MLTRVMRAAPSGWRDRGLGIAAMVVSGLTAYAYLAIAARTLGPASFAALGTLWAATFLTAAALATPLETELARRIGAARGRDESFKPEIRAAFTLVGGVGLLVVVAAVVAGPAVDRALFGGQAGFALAGAVAVAGLFAGAVVKGAYAGSSRFSHWGAYLLADGCFRCLLAVIAALVAPTPLVFALALAGGPWIALLVASRSERHIAAGAIGRLSADAGALATSALPLIVGAGASSSLVYLGAVLLPALIGHPDAHAGSYIAALALARLPLFPFSSLVAIAVPSIAFALERGDGRAATRAALTLIGVALAAGVGCLAAAIAIGPATLEALFGDGYALPASEFLVLAAVSAAWLLATAAAAVSIAARRSRLAAGAWCLGLIAAAAALLVAPSDPFHRTDFVVACGALVAAGSGVVIAGFAILRPGPAARNVSLARPPVVVAPRLAWTLEAGKAE